MIFWLISWTLAVLLTLYFIKIYTHINSFPVSPYVPILGHVFDYRDTFTVLNKLLNNILKYGNTLRQYIGPRLPSLITTDRNLIRFLATNSRHVSKSKFYVFLKPWIGEGLVSNNGGSSWLHRRKLLDTCFAQTAVLKSFVEVFNRKADKLLDNLENHCLDQDVDIHPIIRKTIMDVIYETSMGVSLSDSQLEKYAEAIDALCDVTQNRVFSFLKSFNTYFRFTEDYRKQQEYLEYVNSVVEGLIASKQMREEGPLQKNVLDLMLLEMENGNKTLNKSALKDEIHTLVFAGYDTTSAALSLLLYEIARNPNVQKKILEEQLQIFKEDCVITQEELAEMKYLDQVIKETLRRHPVVPYVGKRTNKDLYFDDHKLPSMLNISVFIYGLHHHPEYFPEPDKFLPERFATKTDPLTFLAFGLKPRQCLGKNFAMLEMKCIVSKILRRYELVPVDGKELKLSPKIILTAPGGIWIKFKKRRTVD